MKLNQLKAFKEERKTRKRKGRGPASGLGCTAGKGNKGQKARSGGGPRVGFEGGQMPLVRRLPKRGFFNKFRQEYVVVNLEMIEKKFQGKEEITLDDLKKFVCDSRPIKILGRGDITRSVKIEAHKFSTTAAEKIKNAGGTVVSLEG